MNTAEVAQKLAGLCRRGEFNQAMESLYGANIVSIEPFDMPNMKREVHGIDGVRKKLQWWETNHEVHSCQVTGPFVSADKFAVGFALDVTEKPTGKRHQMNEIGVYTVADGKVVREEFLYEGQPGQKTA